MPKYMGRGQLAECQRCGEKGFAQNLLRDGRNPNLLVFSDCYDPPHEGEKPYVPKEDEGRPRYPVAPDLLPAIAASTLTFPSPFNALIWSKFQAGASTIVRYEVYRSIDPFPVESPTITPNVLLGTIVPSANLDTGIESYGSPFTVVPSAGTGGPGTYHVRYMVRGVSAHGQAADTNQVSIDVVVS